jgi:hypothetical protein
MQPVSIQRIGKHSSITIGLLLETMFSIRSAQSDYQEDNWAIQLVEGWQFSRALQGRLRRDDSIGSCSVSCELSVGSQPVKGRLEVGVKWPPAWELAS